MTGTHTVEKIGGTSMSRFGDVFDQTYQRGVQYVSIARRDLLGGLDNLFSCGTRVYFVTNPSLHLFSSFKRSLNS